MKNKLPFIVVLCFLINIANVAAAPASFAKAKVFAKQIFADHRKTLYCGCNYNDKNVIDLNSCNMREADNIKRARRVEWEHMMPVENFGRYFSCWQHDICQNKTGRYKGRKCCEKIDTTFRAIEAELYNLWPAVGLVNQARSNYRYAMITEKNGFYSCDFTVDRAARKVEPSDMAKGTVARANLFMSERYKIKLSSSQIKLFEAWNKSFPPDKFEKIWANRVAQIEGYQNHYINDAH